MVEPYRLTLKDRTIDAETVNQLRALYHMTKSQHGYASFAAWLLAPRIKELETIL